jgi:hypothetical protein
MIWPDQFVHFQLLIYLVEFISLYISRIWFYFHLLWDQIREAKAKLKGP